MRLETIRRSSGLVEMWNSAAPTDMVRVIRRLYISKVDLDGVIFVQCGLNNHD